MAKEWAYSYSRLNAFETCPRQHYEMSIAKNFKEEESEQLAWGNRVHLAMAKSCKDHGTPLPADMADYQPWVDRVRGWEGETFLEQKYAVTRDLSPTTYFANNVWLRTIVDVLNVDGFAAVAMDWKTGKIKEDSVQLALTAQVIFSHFPAVKLIKTRYIWLQEDDCMTEEVWQRKDMADLWGGLLPRVEAYEKACKTQNFPPKPSGLCKRWCLVDTCHWHKKGLMG